MATKVIEKMTETMTNTFGNASAVNYYGRQARSILDNSRHVIAESINAKNDNEIVFTSGGTESDNTAIIQTAMARKNEGRHLITTAIEHEAVLKPMAYLEQEGFEVTYLPVDEYGQINLDDLKQAIRSDTILVSIMMGNNEVGSHLPIKEIGEIVAPTNAWFHTDSVQTYGALDIDVQDLKVWIVFGNVLIGVLVILMVLLGLILRCQQRYAEQHSTRKIAGPSLPAKACRLMTHSLLSK